MNNNAIFSINLDNSQFESEMNAMIAEMPKIAKKMMRAVNKVVKKHVKTETRARGYLNTKQMSFGEASISKNIMSFENDDFTGKLMIGRNAFHARFIEYGATPKPKHNKYLIFQIDGEWKKSAGFTIPANPFLTPIANAVWNGNEASEIMDNTLQKELDRIFKGTL